MDFIGNLQISTETEMYPLGAPHLDLAVLCVFSVDLCLNPQEIHNFHEMKSVDFKV